MIYIGIDPGKNGAIAAKVGEEWKWHKWTDNHTHIADFIREIKCDAQSTTDILCAIERATARPAFNPKTGKKVQGSKSLFSFGENYGIWQGMLAALDIPYIIVTPASWQKVCLDNGPAGTTKKRSLDMVSRLYGIHLKKSEDGVADAINLARYAKQYKAI